MNSTERLKLSLELSVIADPDERRSRTRDALAEVGRDGFFLDERDGQLYPYERFGDAEWTLRNLNFAGIEGAMSWEDTDYRHTSEEHRAQHGLLYRFEAARAAVPDGWRLPGDEDWQQLLTPLGGFNQDGSPGVETASDTYLASRSSAPGHFAALLSGYVDHNDDWFHSRGTYGYYWASEDVTTNPGYPRGRSYTFNDLRADVRRGARHVRTGASVRLVRDA